MKKSVTVLFIVLVYILSVNSNLIARQNRFEVHSDHEQHSQEPHSHDEEHDVKDKNHYIHDHVKEEHEHGDEVRDHDEHDHEKEEHDHKKEKDEHGHEHKHSHDGHEHEEGEDIKLTKEQIKASGILVSEAGSGKLQKEISLNGEIRIDIDRQIHHIAKANGICQGINFTLGDRVKKGDALAVIDSAELGQAKSEYFEAFNKSKISEKNLERAFTLKQNVTRLLNTLAKMPENTENLQSTKGDMGEYRAKLISAYTEYMTNKKSFERKNKLYKDKIVSENDFLSAKGDFEKARAQYFSIMDTTSYEISKNLFEAEQAHKSDEFNMRTAEQNLRILGLSMEDIAKLRIYGEKLQKECTDEHCFENTTNSKKHYHTDEKSFSHIDIKSGLSGTIIARDIELGQETEEGRIIFTVADLSKVWAVLQVSSKDISIVKNGMEATIASDEGISTIGKVIMVSPVISEETRTAEVRVLIDNSDGRWRPGSFVTGKLSVSADKLPVVLPKEAVQNVKGTNVVFVETEKGFKTVDVVVGREDSNNIEIKSGLKAGTRYVSSGAFTLKSIVVTSGLDPHAGHGH